MFGAVRRGRRCAAASIPIRESLSVNAPAPMNQSPDDNERPNSCADGGVPGPSVFRTDESGTLQRISDPEDPPGPAAVAAHSALCAFVGHPEYPCVGAKAALARESIVFGLYEQLGAAGEVTRVAEDIAWFADRAPSIDKQFATFVAVFRRSDAIDDRGFERALWRQLQAMHDHDCRRFAWDDRVSDDPSHPDFRYSIGGEAFFVIGLHPAASREARRFAMPALIFNLHTQFQALREDGRFDRMRSNIRDREESLEGRANPFLADHGEHSEAAQYAGRDRRDGWKPPFCPRDADTTAGGPDSQCPITDHHSRSTENESTP